MAVGHLDSEVAYAISNITPMSKEMLFKGGVAFISNLDPFSIPLQKFVEGGDQGYIAMMESIVKDVLALLASTEPQAIYLSGRFTRIEKFVMDASNKLGHHLL